MRLCVSQSQKGKSGLGYSLRVPRLTVCSLLTYGCFPFTSPQNCLKDSNLFSLSCRNSKEALRVVVVVVVGGLHSLGCGRATEK